MKRILLGAAALALAAAPVLAAQYPSPPGGLQSTDQMLVARSGAIYGVGPTQILSQSPATTTTLGGVTVSTGLGVTSSGALSVAYGTTAGTAAQGNDSRFSVPTITGGSISGATISGGSINGADIRTTVRVITGTGTTDTASTSDTLIAWVSTATSAKSETIPVCSSTLTGKSMTVKDASGTASTYPITITPASGTIDKAASLALQTNNGSRTMVCDGISNWMVI